MIRTLLLVGTICVLALAILAPLIILAAASLIVPLLAMPWLSFEEESPFVTYLKRMVICFFVLLTLRMTIVSTTPVGKLGQAGKEPVECGELRDLNWCQQRG